MVKRYAVMDIGTNSVRLMLADVENGNLTVKSKALNTVRIGEGIGLNSGIGEAAMERAVGALHAFKNEAQQKGAEGFYVFATSAVREASNKEEFADRVLSVCGFPVDIISGREEAEIGFLGAAGSGCRRGIIDIGGGSTEVILGCGEDLEYVKSFKVGTVRALSLYPDSETDGGRSYEAMRAWVRDEIKELSGRGFKKEAFIGIGGTATALASIALGLTAYDGEKVQGYSLTADKLKGIFSMLSSIGVEQRKHVTGLDSKRADVIVFGCCLLQEFMSMLGVGAVEVSDRDNLEGYLIKKLGL
jgi:exopolyphosphatase/guanosine-5'-triphosphate,3'-diphosphate pyrophosphatase